MIGPAITSPVLTLIRAALSSAAGAIARLRANSSSASATSSRTANQG